MRFSCPCCGTIYDVPNAKMPCGHFKVVCTNCDYKWRRAYVCKTNVSKKSNDHKECTHHSSPYGAVKPVYKPEVLAILREEAWVETRLRRS